MAGAPGFQYVELPDGWCVVETHDSSIRKLIDAKDRQRAFISYSEDREGWGASLHASLRFRFIVGVDSNERRVLSYVTDCDRVIHRFKPVLLKDQTTPAALAAEDRARKVALVWINEHYPNWRDPAAYWDV